MTSKFKLSTIILHMERTLKFYAFFCFFFSVLLWVVFKIIYMPPNLIYDSYFYVEFAIKNANVNTWPIGYSKFIRWCGIISHSAMFLVTVQYFLLQLSLFVFFVTIVRVLELRKLFSDILFVLLFLNPLFLSSCNFITAETLFFAMSLLWFSTLIWIVQRPVFYLVLAHALILFLAFTVRYNAMYYPVISTFAFLLSRLSVFQKVFAVVVQFILIGVFVIFTREAMKPYSNGVAQFSVFAGWKLANNALYAYEYVNDKDSTAPPEFSELHRVVYHYFIKQHDRLNIAVNDVTLGSNYMFIGSSPLRRFMYMKGVKDRSPLSFAGAAPVAPLYKEYGKYLIKRYPFAYLEHFAFPNMCRYAAPPLEMYDAVYPFELTQMNVKRNIAEWFGLTSISVDRSFINCWINTLSAYKVVPVVIHSFFLLGIVFFFLKRSVCVPGKVYLNIVGLVALLWMVDFVFMSFLASVVIRYELFILAIEFGFVVWFIQVTNDYLIHLRKKER